MMKKKHLLQSNLYACSSKTKSSLYFWYKATVYVMFEVKNSAFSTFYLHQHEKLPANIGNLTDKFVMWFSVWDVVRFYLWIPSVEFYFYTINSIRCVLVRAVM